MNKLHKNICVIIPKAQNVYHLEEWFSILLIVLVTPVKLLVGFYFVSSFSFVFGVAADVAINNKS